MSQENAAVIRGAFGDWNARDWEAWKSQHHADMVAIPPKGWPEHEPVEGCEAWFQRVLLMLEPWDQQRLEIDDVHTAEDLVVLSFHWVASGRESQIEVDIPLTGVYTVTDAKIERIDFFLDRCEALEAVGLRE